MDVLIEFVFEFFAELYLEFVMLIVPNKKFGKKFTVFLKVLTAIVSVGAVACLVIGALAIAEDGVTPTSIALTCVGGGLILLHVFLAVFIELRKRRKKKEREISSALSTTEKTEL